MKKSKFLYLIILILPITTHAQAKPIQPRKLSPQSCLAFAQQYGAVTTLKNSCDQLNDKEINQKTQQYYQQCQQLFQQTPLNLAMLERAANKGEESIFAQSVAGQLSCDKAIRKYARFF
ncbi:hypothetical protein ACEYX7_08785 [Acinetobacter sp. c1-l78]